VNPEPWQIMVAVTTTLSVIN